MATAQKGGAAIRVRGPSDFRHLPLTPEMC